MKKFYLIKQILSVVALTLCFNAKAQFTSVTNQTANALVQTLVGGGITFSNATLVCGAQANGKFTNVNTTLVGIDSGIVLTSGTAVNIGSPAGTFLSAFTGTGGDAQLQVLAGGATMGDVCKLEFDFIPAGDSIKFNYVFASEEYPGFWCSGFADVFGFFINGPGITGTPNIALVPGTTIPVGVNTVNGSTSPGFSCTQYGPGSPFTQYYINNGASTTIAYGGMTHVFTALAQVIPCSTYHLKLAICDGGDTSYDSGVFLKQGSLYSTPITVNPQGGSLNGINALTVPHPYAVRNCLSGSFKFQRAQATPLPHTINYIIGGSAVNGVDYLMIPSSVTIPANQTQASVVINPVAPPYGTDSVILYILNSYNCGINNIIDSVKLYIYDSLQAKILTNDTTICAGQSKQLLAYGDPLFSYSWAPPTYLNNPNIKNPIATPPSTITYVLTATLPGSSCPPVHDVVTITVPQLTTQPTSNSPVCVGQTLSLFAPTGLPVGTTYSWSGPAGWTSNLQNPTRPNATLAFGGTYTLNVTSNGCAFAPVTLNVVINPLPTAAPSSNTPVCVGQPINLFANPGAGTGITYAWTGPNTFTSNLQNPVITPATPANAGIYFLTVTQNGCVTSGLFTFVVIGNAPPTPVAGNNGPVCVGSPINLTANTIPNATYSWTGPNSFTSNLEDPTINPSTLLSAGTYSVTVTTTGCASLPGTTTVVVTPSPVITNMTFTNPSGCNSNTGSITFNITPNGTYNITYQKNSINQTATGTASGGTLTIPNLGAGAYTNFTFTINGCSATYPGPITLVDPAAPPTPTAGGNSPICAGQDILLTSVLVPGAVYSWTGPNNFTSNLQNPTITGATPIQSGNYTVVANVNGCPSAASTVNIVVNPVPATPNTSAANTPVCSGNPLNLTGSPSTPGASWNWTGPGAWSSTQQNPTINPATPANSGNYTVTANIGNCVSQPYTFAVVVNPTPSITQTHTNPSACGLADGSITLNGLTNPGTYTVTYTKNSAAQTPVTVTIPGPAVISNLTAGSYGSIIATLNGCPSNTLGPVLLVDPNAPVTPNASNSGPICAGQSATLTASPAVPGVLYIWTGPNGFTDTADVTTATNILTTSTYSVVANLNGCNSTPATTTVQVNPAPATPTATVNNPICEGDVITLAGGSTVPGAVYNWSGPNGYSATGQVQTIPNADPSLDGAYLLYITAPGVPCNSLSDTVDVVVTPTPAAPLTTDIEVCQYDIVQLTAQGQNLLWYTTAIGGTGVPTMTANTTNVIPTTYYVSQSINSCEGPRAPLTVTVKPQPVPPTVQANYTFCQYDTTATPLTAQGQNLQWYDVATGGSPLPGAPTPNTSIPGPVNYYVTQTDSGCESNRALIEVIIHPKPGLPVVEQITICQDEASPTLNAQGQNLLWYDTSTGGTGTPTAPTPPTNTVGTTDYYVSQTINGCEGDRALIRVTVNPKVVADITIDKDTVCDSYPLLVTFTGIAPTGATYDWSFDGASDVQGTGAGPYTVMWETEGTKTITLTVTNLNCTSTITKTVIVLPTPDPVFNIQPDACLNEKIRVQAGWGQMELPGYNWDFGNAIVTEGTPGTYGPFTLEWNTTGMKVISLSLTNIPCPSLPTYDTINIHHPVAKVMSQSSADICTSDSVMFTAQPGLDYQYEWLPTTYFGEESNSLSMWGVVRKAGYVWLNVTDRWGCKATDSVLLQPKSCCEVFMPNTFTPNGDGKNDVFRMVTQGNHEISVFMIMDRWGKRVFESINQYEAWDGSFNGEAQDMGTYQYYLRFRCADSQEVVEMKGDVILLR